MTTAKKLEYLKKNHLDKFLECRRKTYSQLSDLHYMFCTCGKIATGLHQLSCKNFNNKVDSETVKSLEHLIDEKFDEKSAANG